MNGFWILDFGFWIDDAVQHGQGGQDGQDCHM
jgi:hypothetical protein